MGFDNLNSLETLNLQNNKLQHIPEEIMEPILDTLRVVDIMGKPCCTMTIILSAATAKSIKL